MPELAKIKDELQKGITFHRKGQLHQAELRYQKTLQIHPKNAEAYYFMSMIAHQIGKHNVAIELIKRAIEVDNKHTVFFHSGTEICPSPFEINFDFTEIQNNFADDLKEQGQLEYAIYAYYKSIEMNSDNINAYNNLGNTLRDQGKLEQAILAYRRALKINPRDDDIHNNLGNVLLERGELNEATNVYRHALTINPENSQVYSNLGVTLKKQGKFNEAVTIYQKSLEIQPNDADVYYNLGNSLRELEELEEAINVYFQAIELNPSFASAYNNLGATLQEQGNLDRAIHAYHKVFEINPEDEGTHYNLGTLQLLTGDFKNGWQQYQWRWKCDDFPSENRPFHQPSWNGSNLSAKTILVWAEQGIGDEIMFASMLNDLRQSNANIMVECEQRLISLFQRSFPDIRFFCRTNPPDQQLLNPNIDYQISMGSLGQWLRTDLDSFKQGQSYYLTACPDKTAELRNKYQQLANGRKLVGISWKSTDISQRRAKSKSTSLEYWASVLSQPNCYFINLQYGDIETEVAKFESDTNLKVYQDKEIDPLVNLDGFAAQISALDLVISTSNTTVHMAGALGKRVWTLLPHIPDWRWTLDREEALWYPAMRLFRQSSIGDWQDVFKRVSHALSQSGMV